MDSQPRILSKRSKSGRPQNPRARKLIGLISDYDVFLSPLSDFKKAMKEAGLSDRVVYLDRGDAYSFTVKES